MDAGRKVGYFLSVFLLPWVILSVAGIYHESYNSYLTCSIEGYLFSPPVYDWNFMLLLKIDRFIADLAVKYPTVEWLSLFGIFSIVASWYVLAFSLFGLLKRQPKCSAKISWTLILVVGVVFLTDMFVNFNVTRYEVFVAATGMLTVFHHSFKQNKALFLSGCFLILLGAFIRLETAFIVFGVFSMFQMLNAESFWPTLKKLTVPAVFVGAVTLYFIWQKATSPKVSDKFEDYYYLASNVDASWNVDFDSEADSLVFEAIQMDIIFDPPVINVPLMKRIHERCRVAIQKHYWQWVSARLLVSWETLTHHIQNHFWLILWTNSPLILLWVFAGDNRKRLLYVLTYLVFWGILYLLAFMVKLEARVFTPLLLLLFLSMVFHWVSDKGLVKSNEYLLYVLVGLSPFVFCYEGFQVWQNRQYVEENKKLLSRITGQHKYSIINYDANCTDLFAVYPFTRPELFGKESTVVDAGHLTYCGGTEEHIERILGEKPRSMKHYYEMLSNKKDEVILLGDPIRTEFILSYLRVVWNCVLTLKPVDVLSTESYQTYEIVEMHDIN